MLRAPASYSRASGRGRRSPARAGGVHRTQPARAKITRPARSASGRFSDGLLPRPIGLEIARVRPHVSVYRTWRQSLPPPVPPRWSVDSPLGARVGDVET